MDRPPPDGREAMQRPPEQAMEAVARSLTPSPALHKTSNLEAEGYTEGGGGLWVRIVPVRRSLRERLWDALYAVLDAGDRVR